MRQPRHATHWFRTFHQRCRKADSIIVTYIILLALSLRSRYCYYLLTCDLQPALPAIPLHGRQLTLKVLDPFCQHCPWLRWQQFQRAFCLTDVPGQRHRIPSLH